MKSEHRHQLQTNILADQAGKAIVQAKPYTAMTLGAIAVVAVVGVGLAIWHNSYQRSNSNAWTDYFFANGRADDLIAVYEDFPGSTAADWARQAEADSRMEEALDLAYRDRKTADEIFERARKGYEAVANSTSQPLLKARATFGLAQVHESLGDSEKAISTYKLLKQMESVSPAFASEVDRRIDWLQSSDAKSYFAWYKDFTPTPSAPLNIPGLDNLPSKPDMILPNLPVASPSTEAVSGANSNPPNDTPTAETPAPSIAPPPPTNDGAPQDK